MRDALGLLAESEKSASTINVPLADIPEQQERVLVARVSPPLYVRVLPPVASGSLPTKPAHQSTLFSLISYLSPSLSTPISSSSASVSSRSSSSTKPTSEFFENFMSSWTRLVGDPLLSKWIVIVLAVSISLNGYLLKGIAAGLAFEGGKARERERATLKEGGVRFVAALAAEDETEEKEEEPIVKAPIVKAPVVQTLAPSVAPPVQIQMPPPPRVTMPTFTLDEVDRRLKAKRIAVPSSPLSSSSDLASARNFTTSGPSSSDDEPSSPTPGSSDFMMVRSLEECLDIFDNGPRPLSLSLSLLNDEEVILLAKNGKIAAYALEKVLGSNELERAVRIRRALICK